MLWNHDVSLYAFQAQHHREEVISMAKNTRKNFRRGAVDDRSQTFNPQTNQWVKRDSDTGRFMDVKQDGTPFKGFRQVIWLR
jgi:PhoPQ-activated pathogenicity-related protein